MRCSHRSLTAVVTFPKLVPYRFRPDVKSSEGDRQTIFYLTLPRLRFRPSSNSPIMLPDPSGPLLGRTYYVHSGCGVPTSPGPGIVEVTRLDGVIASMEHH